MPLTVVPRFHVALLYQYVTNAWRGFKTLSSKICSIFKMLHLLLSTVFYFNCFYMQSWTRWTYLTVVPRLAFSASLARCRTCFYVVLQLLNLKTQLCSFSFCILCDYLIFYKTCNIFLICLILLLLFVLILNCFVGPIICFKASFQSLETIAQCEAVYIMSQENIWFINMLCWHCPQPFIHKAFWDFTSIFCYSKPRLWFHTHLKVKINWSEFMLCGWIERWVINMCIIFARI